MAILKLSQQGLRKAAVLVSTLDMAAADAVLDQLTEEQAQNVRELVMEMGEVDDNEQQRVIEEFYDHGPKTPTDTSGVELDGHLAWLNSRAGSAQLDETLLSPEQNPQFAGGGKPFRFLLNADVAKAAKVLADERAQTIALVLSQLPSDKAGHILQRLPAALQVEVVRRLVDLEEIDPEIMREVEIALQARFAQDVQFQRKRVAGLHAVAGILQATESRASLQILDNLARRDRSLAENLGPRDIDFNELVSFSSEELAAVFAEAGPELMLPALLGASPALLDRILSGIAAGDAALIRRRLNRPGPIRLRDVDEARRQIGRIAGRVRYQLQKPKARAA